MSEWKARRFWTRAEAVEDEAGYAISLDARPVRTPAKTLLVVPTRAMADAIAAEWDAQQERIDPMTMPVTRSANATLDKVVTQFDEVADMIAGYGDTDLLCYRAHSPVELIARQDAAWNPMLDWAESALDARLHPVVGVMHAPQCADALARLRAQVHGLDPFSLTALHDLVSLSGSLVLGLAALRDAFDIETLWSLSRVDETWQQDLWGKDDEAQAQAEMKRAAFLHAKRFHDLSKTA